MIRAASLTQILGLSSSLTLAVYCVPLAAPATELYPYQVVGTGGPIPAVGGGGGGAWPDSLPSSPFVSAITLPTYALSIEEIEIVGLNHARSGDLQVVLVDPNGVGHNLVHRPGFSVVSPSQGYVARFSGDYGLLSAGSPEITQNWPLVDPGLGATIPSGDYGLEFGGAWGGKWPSGAAGIENTGLDEIPVVPGGVYKLVIYDWRTEAKGNCLSWAIEGEGLSALPRTYCTSGASSAACVAAISANVNPTVNSGEPCIVSVDNVQAGALGMFLYGIDNDGFLPKPWKGGPSWVCVSGPTARTDLTDSGGLSACDGRLVLDWTAFQAAHPDALGQPWTLGQAAFLQAWIRDPGSPQGSITSDALELTYLP